MVVCAARAFICHIDIDKLQIHSGTMVKGDLVVNGHARGGILILNRKGKLQVSQCGAPQTSKTINSSKVME